MFRDRARLLDESPPSAGEPVQSASPFERLQLTPKKEGWLPEIDGLRAIAAMSVIFHHLNGALVDKYLLLPLANVAVAGFFSLSGFLLFFLFEREITAKGRIAINYYFRRRALRIWPLYFAMILAGALISFLTGTLQKDLGLFFQLVTFSSNLWMAAFQAWPPNILPPFWSIGAEEHLYVMAPILFLLTRRIGWVLGLAAPIAISTTWRVYSVATLPPEQAGQAGIYFATYSYVDIFLVGGLAALCYTHREQLASHWLFKAAAAPIAVWGWLCMLLAVGALWKISIFPPFKWYSPLIYNLLSVVLAGLLLAVLMNSGSAISSLLRHPILRVLGILSYSMYAAHVAAIQLFQYFSPRGAGVLAGAIHTVGVFATVVVLSSILYALVERPFQRLKARGSPSDGLQSTSVPWITTLAIGLVTVGIANYVAWTLR